MIVFQKALIGKPLLLSHYSPMTTKQVQYYEWRLIVEEMEQKGKDIEADITNIIEMINSMKKAKYQLTSVAQQLQFATPAVQPEEKTL